MFNQQLNLIVNVFAREEDKVAFDEYLDRMKAIGLFTNTNSIENKVINIGPTVDIKKKEFQRMRVELAFEITIAKRDNKQTFMHVVYNGPAQISRNADDSY